MATLRFNVYRVDDDTDVPFCAHQVIQFAEDGSLRLQILALPGGRVLVDTTLSPSQALASIMALLRDRLPFLDTALPRPPAPESPAASE